MTTTKKFNTTSSSGWDHRLSIKLLPMLIAGCLSTEPAWSNPSGAQTVSGQVSYATSGNVLTITNTPGAIINWQNFSINAGEITRFNQQSASSSVLNRVAGQNPSQILGALQSNGKVFLINPNGIVFGAGAQVNVNGLVASTLNLTNENFLAGKLNFNAGTSAGSISNQGTITTPSGGQVYLIAPHIENSGIITSPKGDVMLAAGRSVQLVDSSNPDLQVVISAPTDQAINLGQVMAQGGKIGIYGGLINQRGTINANSAVVGENGKIVFKASGDTLLEAGSVTSATGTGKGGDIQVLGDRVGLTGDATIDASGRAGGGTVLVGGDYHGGNASIQNAKRTYVGAGTQIKADAIDSGDGGKVIVWSDDTTRASGSIVARGGAHGGNGGFVEVSGKQTLDFHAKVDVSAASGKGGTLLLDPATITLVGGTGDGDVDGTSTFQGSSTAGTANFSDAGPTIIYQSELEGLTPGINLVLEATDYISTSGTFGNLVTLPTNSSLVMRTRNAATDGTGMIGINLVGSTDGINLTFATQGTGTITLQTGVGSSPQAAAIQVGKLVTSGGSVTLAGSGNVTVGDITTTPSAPGTGGNVSISASGGYIAVGRNIDARGNSAGNGNVTLNAAGAINVNNSFQENYPIFANQLTMTANGGISGNGTSPLITQVNTITASNIGTGVINLSNIGDMTVAGSGITQSGGDIVLGITAGGNINIAAPIDAGAGNIALNVDGAIVQNSGGSITGASLSAMATNGIGHGTALVTTIGTLAASNSGTNTDINIVNTGALTVNDVTQSTSGSIGNINIDNTGAVTKTSGTSVTSQQGSITLTAHSPLTINGTVQSMSGGNINLSAGATGSSADKLTVASTGIVNTSGIVTLQAGDAIINNGSVVGGTVTQTANINGPTLSQCIANPAIAGCSALLPSVTTCTAAPSTAGCAAVLPTLAQCISTPMLAGCAAVLPSVSVCVANPTVSGCAVVLPPLATQTTVNAPVTQAINTTVNLINTVTTTMLPSSPPPFMALPGSPATSTPAATNTTTANAAGSASSTADVKKDDTKKDDKKENKQDTVTAKDTGAKKDESVKKLYCN